MQQSCGGGPRSGVLETNPSKHKPGEQPNQQIRREQHQQVFLNRVIDVIQYVYGDFLPRQRRPCVGALAYIGAAAPTAVSKRGPQHRIACYLARGAGSLNDRDLTAGQWRERVFDQAVKSLGRMDTVARLVRGSQPFGNATVARAGPAVVL